MNAKDLANLYIIWGDYEGQWTGYLVRLPKPGHGSESKLFTPTKYKGKVKAKLAATKWRNERYQELWGRSVATAGNGVHRNLSADNKSGTNGVFLDREGHWVANAPYGVRAKFSVKKFGASGAEKLAKLARKIFVTQAGQ